MAEHTPRNGRPEYSPASIAAAELHTHFEDLLNTIRQAEALWRRDDRMDLAMRLLRRSALQERC